ncbi:hypothetical protein B0A55_12403, partial [Friedmanniomyces simplex]
MSNDTAAPRRSRRIASQEPEEMGLPLPTKPRASKKASPWDVIAASTRVINGDRDSALSLTQKQRLAIIDNITARFQEAESEVTTLAARNEELERKLHVAEAAATVKRSLQADSMQMQIQQKLQERRAAAAASSQALHTAIEDAKRESVPTPPSQASTQPKRRVNILSPSSQLEQELVSEPQRTSSEEPDEYDSHQHQSHHQESRQQEQNKHEQDKHEQDSRERQLHEQERDTYATSTYSEPAALEPEATEPEATEPEPTTAPPATPLPAWRRVIGTAANLFSPFSRRAPSQKLITNTAPRKSSGVQQQDTTPLGELTPARRKRSAEDETNTARPAKRATPMQRPTPAEHQTLSQRPTPSRRSRQAGHQTAPVSKQRRTTPSREQTPTQHKTAPRPEPQSATSSREHTPEQSHNAPPQFTYRAGPSTEQTTTKRKHSAAPAEEEETPRPAKTPRAFLMPSTKNRRVPTSLSTVTEYTEYAEEISEFGSSLLAGTTPSKPPQRRTVASARASRLRDAGTPLPPLSWEQRAHLATPIAPAESNADRRFEKAERLRKLQKELAELNQDEDIIEMESHRRKRVKVDDLQYIPHNRPGESSGTFRVPDIDSDDEMEVEMSVPERVNVFEEAAAGREPSPEPMWVFPSVGKRDPNEPRL